MPHPKGGYKLKDGTKVPGVTKITGRFKDSGGLLFWAFEQGKAAERGEISRLYDKRDEAGESGTLAHAMVENHINGIKPVLSDSPTDIETQAWQAFQSYLAWESMTRLEIIEQEMELVSEKYGYGGCPDAIGIVNGKLSLVDWKTSNDVYPDYRLQLAAYRNLWEENYPDRPLKGGFHLCRFSKTSGAFAHHFYPELEIEWEQFKALVECYKRDKIIKKRG